MSKQSTQQTLHDCPDCPSGGPDAGQLNQMIAEAAYYKAEARGFRGGDPRQDWLEAEAELMGRSGSAPDGA